MIAGLSKDKHYSCCRH